MKVTIDKKFTTIANADTVKKALKGFKSYYTDSDLLEQFNSAVRPEWDRISGDILECNVTGYDNHFGTSVGIQVSMLVYIRGYRFYDIRFYGDIEYDGTLTNINTDSLLVNVETFRQER